MKAIQFNIRTIFLNLFVVLAIACSLMACSASSEKDANSEEGKEEEHHEEEEGTVEFTEAQYKAASITLGGIEKRQLSGVFKVNGLLDVPPQNQVSISVPFGGILKNTELLQGMWVNKGQVIARMEHPDYIQMQQDYLQAASELSFMEKEYKRQEELNKENVSAAKTFERTTSEYNSLKSRVEGLRQKLSLINLNADNISNSGIVNSIPLISPISGYVTEVNANIGKFIPSNEVIFEIVDTRHLHVELMVFEKDVPKLKVGQKVRYTLANESKERKAEIHLIGREISPERTIRVHCHLMQEDKNLLPGMYLKATIETGASETNALPNEAIVNSAGKNFIFIQIPAEEEHHEEKHEEGHEETDKEKEADTEHGEEAHGFKFKVFEITTGVSDGGYTEVVLPEGLDINSKNIVLKGAYDLLSKMNNSEEEGGHGH